MNVTIIAPDKFVGVNGLNMTLADYPFTDKFTAIQWYGDHGHIQRSSGAEPIADFAHVKPYVKAWSTEFKKRLQQGIAQADELKARLERELAMTVEIDREIA